MINTSKMVNHLNIQNNRNLRVLGWYHSHPGYGCWLSGIDVGTQSTWQQWEDPFVAVVVDPDRTVSAGKVEIGAFRCYPEGYVAPDAPSAAALTASALSSQEYKYLQMRSKFAGQ